MLYFSVFYFRLAASKSFHCGVMKRFGKVGDGGYEICLDPPFTPKQGDCLVYSFGYVGEILSCPHRVLLLLWTFFRRCSDAATIFCGSFVSYIRATCVMSHLQLLNSFFAYDFSINYDFSFDEAISNEFDCRVESFDPRWAALFKQLLYSVEACSQLKCACFNGPFAGLRCLHVWLM